jgi:hypothetical protein
MPMISNKVTGTKELWIAFRIVAPVGAVKFPNKRTVTYAQLQNHGKRETAADG